MKIIAITQRVERIKDYNEVRDALDERWLDFFDQCSLTPLIIPNHIPSAQKIILSSSIDGVLLTGGGDLTICGGEDKHREEVEGLLLEMTFARDLPLIGVCRGMQFLQNHYQIPLKQIQGHVVKEQTIVYGGQKRVVNSYCNWGTEETKEPLKVISRSKDNIIKSVSHNSKPIHGIMWHPERFDPFQDEDISFFKEVYHV